MEQILLADDNVDLRSALRLLLETRLAHKTIIEANDMEHVLAQIKALNPDCIIIDWELPGYPARKRISILRGLAPGLKVIALSARPESKQSALKEGVDAFVSKAESPIVILEKLQKICQRKKSV